MTKSQQHHGALEYDLFASHSIAGTQTRTLVRTRDLAGFREALIERIVAAQPLAVRRQVVIVPTRAAAALLRQSIERAAIDSVRKAVVLPDMVTRDEWLQRLQVGLRGAPSMLGRTARELVMRRAAEETARRRMAGRPPFDLRPRLVAAILDLYDALQRRQRPVRRFARTLFDQLRGERGIDRGTDSLLQQTAFLGFAFLAYERAVVATGALDEHGLRRRLLAEQPDLPFDHVVVAVADHPADLRGLWPADFDLIGRLHGIRRLDLVMTDEMHDAGFRDRAEQELPGIVEERRPGSRRVAPLVRPAAASNDLCVVARDREEELRAVARAIRTQADGESLTGPAAIVFHRPLPYLYLAQQVLDDAGIPYEAWDALPLAGEPYAALLDLVLTFARTGGTREAAVALLRSPILRFAADSGALEDRDAAALDAILSERRAAGEADSYAHEVEGYFRGKPSRDGWDAERARRAAMAAAAIRLELQPFRDAATSGDQIAAVAAFLRRHETVARIEGPDDRRDRASRARAAVLGCLDELADACRRHDDAARSTEELTALLRHVLEGRTFMPRRGDGGVQLVDAMAARFATVDHTHIVGLVDTDWAERPARNIFYTSGLLKTLGWPQEAEQTRARQAAFRDLLGLAAQSTTLYAFHLEGDAIVGRAPVVDLARGMPQVDPPSPPEPLFFDELMSSTRPPVEVSRDPAAARWLALRRIRPNLDDRAYRGFVGARSARAYRVSRVDHYVDCPFKFFAEDVLQLPEEREESSGLTPLERGILIHEVFEKFYRQWQTQGGATITAREMPDALALFSKIAAAALERFPAADRALETTRLLGSIVATGLGERVFQLEADAPERVVRRHLELPLRGTYTFPASSGISETAIAIRGKADRIDVLENGLLRVIDYKLSKLPDVATSLQIAVYAHATRQELEQADGRAYQIGAAMYLAFGDDRELEGTLGKNHEATGNAVQARIADFVNTIGNIEAGSFPARPRRPGDCQWCRYAGVCRKEYLAEDDEAADAV